MYGLSSGQNLTPIDVLTVVLFLFLLHVYYSYQNRHCNRPPLTQPTGLSSLIAEPELPRLTVWHPFYPSLDFRLVFESLLCQCQFVFHWCSIVFLVGFLSLCFHSNLLKLILMKSFPILILYCFSYGQPSGNYTITLYFMGYIFVGSTFWT